MAHDRLRIVTWNAWFGDFEHEARRRGLWQCLASVDPDVVCLQEMIYDDLGRPELQRWQQRGYWVSDAHIGLYDVLMISRVKVTHRERLPLTTTMGRNLLLVRLDVDPPLTVGTVHLESTAPMSNARVQQLRDINDRMQSEAHAVLAGDMNFSDDDPEETAEVQGWRDAWLELRPGDPGFTVDSQANRMRPHEQHVQKRIDRVFCKGDGWRADRIERLGTDPFAEDPLTHVSDHFGLMVELTRER